MIPILCINLKRATERRSFIEEEWIEKRGCDVTFIEAYDRRDIETWKHLFDYDEDTAKKYIRRKLTPGEIGCIASHILTIQTAKANNMSEFVVIEDDAVPLFKNASEFYNSLSYIDKEYPHAEVAMLFERKYVIKEKKEHYGLVSKTPWGNIALYFKSTGVDQFVNSLKLFHGPADWPPYWEKYCKENKLITPLHPLIKHRGESTYIENIHRGIKRQFIQ